MQDIFKSKKIVILAKLNHSNNVGKLECKNALSVIFLKIVFTSLIMDCSLHHVRSESIGEKFSTEAGWLWDYLCTDFYR
jgi:hypothetical protein